MVEVTVKAFQGRKLLTPSAQVNDVILGVLGRASHLYPESRMTSFDFLSNHGHLDFAPLHHEALSEFMNHAQSNIAREVGTRLRGWTSKFWDRRYRPIPILDEESMIRRLKYLLSHGVKEGLVATPSEWPGVSCLESLLTGKPAAGTWYDRTAEYNARRTQRGKDLPADAFATRYEIPLWPLPCWAGLSQDERAARVRALVQEIEEEAAERLLDGHSVLGRSAVLHADPIARPEKLERTPAPPCHASSWAARIAFLASIDLVADAHARASTNLRNGQLDVQFPEGTFRPDGGFVPWTEERGPP